MKTSEIKYLNYKDLARHFGRSTRTVRRWLDLHGISRIRVTRRSVFITDTDLRRLERALAKKEEV